MTHLFRSRRERRLWGFAAATLAAIYASLPFVRSVSNALRDRGWLANAILLVLAAAALVIVVAILRRRPGWRQMAVLTAMALLYAVAIARLRQPEERMHLLQYGLFGALVFAALRERLRVDPETPPARRRRVAATIAVVVTGAAGWLDEGIQYFLPNRYYDLRDVWFNFLAGVLAVTGMLLVAGARRRDEAARLRPEGRDTPDTIEPPSDGSRE